MRKLVCCAVLFLAGCAAQLPPIPEVRYLEIPEGYLQSCELPPAPDDTSDLSDAFVIAYKCAEQGNKDKEKIRALGATE